MINSQTIGFRISEPGCIPRNDFRPERGTFRKKKKKIVRIGSRHISKFPKKNSVRIDSRRHLPLRGPNIVQGPLYLFPTI